MLTLKFDMLPRQSGIFGLISNWRDCANEVGINIIFDNYASIDQDAPHPIPARARTFFTANGKRILLDGQDQSKISGGLQGILVDKGCDLIIKMQYHPNYYTGCPIKVVPFTYYTVNHEIILASRALRTQIMSDKSFAFSTMWAGTCTGNPQRQTAKTYIKENGKLTWCEQVDFETYIEYITKSLIGVMIRGVGFFCHRDMEFMGIGTAAASKYYRSITHNQLIPDYHYYADDNDNIEHLVASCVSRYERDGQLLIPTGEEWDKYQEITNNAMKWYDDNASPTGSLKLLAEILEANNII